jgi:hypothetical protein
MKDCKHEYRMQPDENGIVLCHHCNYPVSKEEIVPSTYGEPISKPWELPGGGIRPEYANAALGTKNDAGKPDLSLFPREAIEAGSRAFMFGEKKYARDNWRKGISKERLVAATLRHLFAWKDGELSDPESNLSHLDHAMASLAMLVTLHKE